MRKTISQFLAKLSRARSGNATLMVALGIPALVGGSGLAVDVAQWYLWKRELQFAVDQSAVAGAFALAETATANDYSNRAQQEFTANLAVTAPIASTPTVTLQDYDGGTDNLVVVTANATQKLPFSSFLTGRATTVAASAQATFEQEQGWTSCIIALDPTASKAIWFNGGPDVNAACGVAAISTASNAVEVSGGSGSLDLGWVIAGGGIDNYFDSISGTIVVENATNLIDPFAGLTPPTNATSRTLDCTSSPATHTATYDVSVTVDHHNYEGPKRNQLSLVGTTLVSQTSSTEQGAATSSTQVGDSTTTSETEEGPITSTGSGNNKTYYRTDTVTTTTRTVTAVSSSGGSSGNLQPGTYSDFKVSGNCTMSPGVYVIDGGTVEMTSSGSSLSGSGVMFVLKNGAGIKITGGSTNLTAMGDSELTSLGVSATDAEKMRGILFFEDPNSSGNTKNKINGNAGMILNGTIYLPQSGLDFLGTAGVTSRCLMIAAKTVQIGGTADMSTFCPPGLSHDVEVAKVSSRVRLVG